MLHQPCRGDVIEASRLPADSLTVAIVAADRRLFPLACSDDRRLARPWRRPGCAPTPHTIPKATAGAMPWRSRRRSSGQDGCGLGGRGREGCQHGGLRDSMSRLKIAHSARKSWRGYSRSSISSPASSDHVAERVFVGWWSRNYPSECPDSPSFRLPHPTSGWPPSAWPVWP